MGTATHKDPVERIELSSSEIASLRKKLRIRFGVFMLLAVILSLASIYDHVMVKILMMFLLVILFWHFLKFHLRMKYDIDEGMKCVERVQVNAEGPLHRSRSKSRLKVQSAYGVLELPLAGSSADLKPLDRIRIEYLPLSTHVIRWERTEE